MPGFRASLLMAASAALLLLAVASDTAATMALEAHLAFVRSHSAQQGFGYHFRRGADEGTLHSPGL